MAAKLPPKCIIPTVTLGCLPYLDAESRVEDVDAMVQFLTARVFCGATSPLLGPQQKPRIRPRLGLPIPFKHLDLHCHFLCLILAPGPLTLLTTLLPRPGFHFDTHTPENLPTLLPVCMLSVCRMTYDLFGSRRKTCCDTPISSPNEAWPGGDLLRPEFPTFTLVSFLIPAALSHQIIYAVTVTNYRQLSKATSVEQIDQCTNIAGTQGCPI